MSIAFNGNSNNYLSRSASLINYNNPYTIMCWYKITTDTGSTPATLFNLAVGASDKWDLAQFWASISSDSGRQLTVSNRSGTTINRANEGAKFAVGTWIHVALTRVSASRLDLYVNGGLHESVTGDISARAAIDTFEIGRTHVLAFTGEPLNGKMAHLRAWTQTLTATQIGNEMRHTTPQFTTNIYGDWPLATGASAATDNSGQSHPLTVNGSFADGSDEPLSASNPTADAGIDQNRISAETIMLNGANSYNPTGAITTYLWSQPAGLTDNDANPITFSSTSVVNPTFTAPTVTSGSKVLTLRLQVNGGPTDDVVVTVYPTSTAQWLHFAPQEVGMGPVLTQDAANGAPGPAMIIHNGRIIAQKGTVTTPNLLWSASKSLIALVFGRLKQQGLANYDDNVPLSNVPTNPLATYRAHMRMTSDYSLSPHNPPNANYAYNNGGVHHYGTQMKTNFYSGNTEVQMLQNAYATALGFQDTISFTGYLSGWDGGYSLSCRDLARLCQMILNGGTWGGSQIISSAFVTDLYSNQIPGGAIKNTDTSNSFYNEEPASTSIVGAYSFGFWIPNLLTAFASAPFFGYGASANACIAMDGAAGTSAYISSAKNLIFLNLHGGAGNTSGNIPSVAFDNVVAAILPAQTITGTGIASGAAFGAGTVSIPGGGGGAQTITGTGLVSGAAFGAGSLVSAGFIQGVGIPSGAVFGAGSLSLVSGVTVCRWDTNPPCNVV